MNPTLGRVLWREGRDRHSQRPRLGRDPHAQQAEWQSVARTGSVVTPEGNESYCTHAPARISQAGRTTGGCQTVIGTADPAGDGQETKMTSFDGTEQI